MILNGKESVVVMHGLKPIQRKSVHIARGVLYYTIRSGERGGVSGVRGHVRAIRRLRPLFLVVLFRGDHWLPWLLVLQDTVS